MDSLKFDNFVDALDLLRRAERALREGLADHSKR
jgi:hypothetical protein